MPQPQPSTLLVTHATAVRTAALKLRHHVIDVAAQAEREGLKFPDLLQHLLRSLERDLDQIALVLNPSYLAEDQSRRDDRQNSPSTGAQAPAQD